MSFGSFKRKPIWDLIPEDVDVLITHMPPHEIRDVAHTGRHWGCPDLRRRVEHIKPKYHLFGHCHEGYGKITIGETTFINCAILNDVEGRLNDPIVVDFQRQELKNEESDVSSS
eukprot:TRINITY_DN6687_c0_g1_i1.p1 TRINITY_DN6687_c0_g1~~TRINITY_DN6687_c0_g1_i1.p1  ORF type:complete len:114 (+),score=21.58 TRINITY_DN6687_c0_g1_i1:688-1029(+)